MKFTITEDFPWPACPDDAVKAAWENIKMLKSVKKYGDELEAWGNEDDDLHPVLYDIISTTSSIIRSGTGNQLKFHLRPRICGVVPDMVGTSDYLKFPSWTSAMWIGEYKIPGNLKAGFVQAYDYVQDAIEEDDEVGKVGVAIDFRSIQAIQVAPSAELRSPYGRDVLDLFPKGWRKRKNPTRGFSLLCASLMVPLPLKSFQHIIINGESVDVDSVVTARPTSHVYQVSVDGKPLAIKVCPHACRNDTVYTEMERIREMMEVPALTPFIVPIDAMYTVKDGFAMPLGLPLHDFVTDLVTKVPLLTPEDFLLQIRDLLVQSIDGVFALHASNFFHNDIRPHNMVVLNGSLRFIDWVTRTKMKDQMEVRVKVNSFYDSSKSWPTAQDGFIRDLSMLMMSWFMVMHTKAELSRIGSFDNLCSIMAEEGVVEDSMTYTCTQGARILVLRLYQLISSHIESDPSEFYQLLIKAISGSGPRRSARGLKRKKGG